MNGPMLVWLRAAGTWAWQASVVLLIVVNVAAVAVVSVTRDRGIVNRWTSTWLGINVGLLAVGAGVPMVTGLLRLAVKALPNLGPFSAHLPK
jgi:hypothetical protein